MVEEGVAPGRVPAPRRVVRRISLRPVRAPARPVLRRWRRARRATKSSATSWTSCHSASMALLAAALPSQIPLNQPLFATRVVPAGQITAAGAQVVQTRPER